MRDIKKQLRENKYLNPIVTAIGLFFIFLAILGAFLPIIPGFVFLFIGLIILGEEFFLTRWILKRSPKSLRDKLEKRKNGGSNNDK
ncbi:MAG: hypothetical protein Q7S53_02300 [bacterium]|nr:hypothetical protein [bacterium]